MKGTDKQSGCRKSAAFSAVGGIGKGHWNMSEVALGGHYSEECSSELGQGFQFHSPVALQPTATLHGYVWNHLPLFYILTLVQFQLVVQDDKSSCTIIHMF